MRTNPENPLTVVLLAVLAIISSSWSAQAADVTFASLLEEMAVCTVRTGNLDANNSR
jgi:hypothetical protein